jgi:hypothetical protein
VQIQAGQDDDGAFITEMAQLACVIEDRPLPRPDAGEVIEMLRKPATLCWWPPAMGSKSPANDEARSA